MAINYPSSLDGTAQLSQPAGSTLVTAIDHAVQHDNLSSLGTVLENLLGTTSGTNLLRNIAAASDGLIAANSGGTLKQTISGTVNLMGQGTNTGTTSGGVYGTATYQGGTANAITLAGAGTNSGTYSGGVYGTATWTGGTINATIGTLGTGWAGFQSGGQVYLAGAGTAANGADTIVPFDTVEEDLGGEFTTGGTARLVLTNSGKYIIGFNTTLQMAANKQMSAIIYLNGAVKRQMWSNASGATNQSAHVTTRLNITVPGTIQFYIHQDDTTGRTMIAGANNTYAYWQRVG